MDDRNRITPKLMDGIVGLRYTESGNSIMFGIERKNDYIKPLKQNKMFLVNLTRYKFLWQNFEDTVLQISTVAIKQTTKRKPHLVYEHYIIVFEEQLDRFEFTCRLGKNAIQRDNSQAQPDSQYIDYNTFKTAIMLELERNKKKQISRFKRWVASKTDKLFGKDGEPEVAISYPEPEPVTPSSQAGPRSAIEHPVEVDTRKCKKNRPPPLDDSLHVENDEEPDPVRSLHPTNRAHESPIVTKVGPSMASITRHGFESSRPLPQSAPPLMDLPEPESVTRSSQIEPRSATEHLVEVDTRKRKKNRPPQLDVSLHVEDDEEPVTASSQSEPRSATEHPLEVDTRKRKKNRPPPLDVSLHVEDDEEPNPVRSPHPTNRTHESLIVTKVGPSMASITRHEFESSRSLPQSAPPLARPSPFLFEGDDVAEIPPSKKIQFSRPLPQSAPASTGRDPQFVYDLQNKLAKMEYPQTRTNIRNKEYSQPNKNNFSDDPSSDEEGRPLHNQERHVIPDEYLASKRFESTTSSKAKFEPRSPVAKLITDFEGISESSKPVLLARKLKSPIDGQISI